MSANSPFFSWSASWKYDGNVDEDIIEAKRDSIRRALMSVALLLERKIKEKLSQPGTGRIYPSKLNANIKHQASARGEPPAADVGAYRASWHASGVEEGDVFTVAIGTQLWWKFGRRLELGGQGRSSSYIAPRPHVRPVFEENKEEIQRILDTI